MKTRINITIDPEVVEELDRQAEAEGRSRSGMVERLVRQFVTQASEPLPETKTMLPERKAATDVGPKQEVAAPAASGPRVEPVTGSWEESP